MIKARIVFVIFFLLLQTVYSQVALAQQENSQKVLFIYPMDKGFPFWDSQLEFAQAVAKAFNFDMQVAYTPAKYRNRFGAATFVERILENREWQPDLIISSFWLGSEQAILTMLEQRDIALITVNSDISEQQFEQLGRPREKYPNWLYHLSPDDTLAGQQLAQGILEASRKQRCANSQCNVNFFAITGLRYSLVSEQRATGLELALADDENAQLLNLIYGRWDRDHVAGLTPRILKRHKNDIDAFWVASDSMAFGLLDGMQNEQDLIASKVIVGSIDWSPETIENIKQGRINMSLGGHFMEAGWGLILYYDHLRKRTPNKPDDTVYTTRMSMLNENNIQAVAEFLTQPKWTDELLRSYSLHLNPNQGGYRFNPRQLIMSQISHNKFSKPQER